ncbi:MAG TPA: hypothetical protein VMT66_16685 [Steroidobacteraceae bacterium]|nr:hypothetical protein [Steroidobacteraceae bacterium]
MSTPFNNQWLLGRARARRRERPPAAPEAAAVPRQAAVPRHPRRTPGFGPAVAGTTMRKHPRWVDRDT